MAVMTIHTNLTNILQVQASKCYEQLAMFCKKSFCLTWVRFICWPTHVYGIQHTLMQSKLLKLAHTMCD